MAREDGRTFRWPARWSESASRASAARSALRQRTTDALDRAPAPIRQGSRLIWRTGRDTVEDRVPGLAAEAALFTLISLPALLLAVIGSLGYIAEALGPGGSTELRRLVLGIPEPFLSERTYGTWQQLVEDVIAQQRGGIVSLGIALSVWTGSRAVNRYLETITIAYGVAPRPAWRRRLLALGLTIAGLLGAVAMLPPLVIGPRIVEGLASEGVADATLRAFDVLFWPAIAVVVLAALVTFYHVGVPWKTPWRRDVPGALLAMALWLVASAGLRAYLTFTVDDGAVYSRLAVPIAVVLWLYVTAIAVLLGAEFNAEIEKMWPHRQHPWRLRRSCRRAGPALTLAGEPGRERNATEPP